MRAKLDIIGNMEGDEPQPKMLGSIIMDKVELAGKITGIIGALIIFSAFTAVVFNFTIGLFIDYPLTWGNFGKTWLVLICFNLLANRIKGNQILKD